MSALEGRKYKQGTSWRVIYYWNGVKEQIKIGFTSRRVALQQKTKIDTLIASNKNPKESIYSSSANISLSQLTIRDNEWCRSRKRARTIEINTQAMRRLQECLGDIRIESVTQSKVEKFLSYLRDSRGYSDVSINMYLRQLKAVFQRAVDEYNYIKDHPFRKLKPFTSVNNTSKAIFLTSEQIAVLLESIEDQQLKRIIQFYLWTGCRRSEAAELTVDDIDIQNKLVYLGHPDSQTKLRRAFPMTERLEELIKQQLSEPNHNGKVFGKYAENIRLVSKKIRTIRAREPRLPDNLTLHTLRHSFASHMVMQGVDLSTIADLLGHSTTRVTELYSHLQTDHKFTAANKLPY